MSRKKKKSKLKRGLKIFLITVFILIAFFIISLVTYSFIQTDKMKNTIEKYLKNQKLNKEFGNEIKDINFSLNSPYYTIYPKVKDDKINKLIKDNKNAIRSNYKKKSLIDSILNNNYKYQVIDYENFLAPDNIVGLVYIESNINSKGKLLKENIYSINIGLKEKEVLKDSYIFVGDYKEIITNYLIKYFEDNKYKLKKNYKKVLNDKNDYKYALTNSGINIYFDYDEIIKNKDIVVTIPYEDINSVINIDFSKKSKKYNDSISNKNGDYTDVKKDYYVKTLSNLYKKDRY